ncbi:Taurine--pyruvate aminotransferase [compost metagenome]
MGGSGFFQHGHTYIGHATACAAALAVQRTIVEDGLLENVRARGEQLRNELHAALRDHPNVGDIRGRGLFVGVELVAERATKETLDPARKTHAKFKAQAKDNGLLVYPMGGTVDGVRGDHVLIAPPFIASEADIGHIVDRFVQTMSDVLPR